MSGPSVPSPEAGVDGATRRYLLYGVLPAWFIPGLLDWRMHRQTRIEETSGLRESMIHTLMMAEVGLPILGGLLLQINRRVLAVMAGAALAHEATAIWDVRTAYDSTREVTPAEQHIHSFLESLPFTALAALACLHWDELRRPAPTAPWLQRKDPPLAPGYIATILAAIGGFIALPYGEELLRCWRRRPHGPHRNCRGRARRTLICRSAAAQPKVA
ncbi:MAG: diguanylate cyclase/phosphodiesterase [Pseudonocardiales bacterium]|nr:diguanylate cyclase/phosphodiesterase [Pseudonocardiales bacterium]